MKKGKNVGIKKIKQTWKLLFKGGLAELEKELQNKSWEEGFQYAKRIFKEQDNYFPLGSSEDNKMKEGEDPWGYMQRIMGYGGELSLDDDLRKKRRESLEKTAPKILISERERKKWKHNGWFNSTEVAQYDSREQPDSDLGLAQDASYTAFFNDPHYASLIMNYKNYIIGGGITFSSPVDEIQDFLMDFWERNELEDKQDFIITKILQEGEYFMGLQTDPSNGKLKLLNYRTYEIQDILVDPNNRDSYLGYAYCPAGKSIDNSEITWIADYRLFLDEDSPPETIPIKTSSYSWHTNQTLIPDPNNTLLFIRHNYGDEIRGRVPFAQSLKWFRMGRDFLFDRFILNHSRNRVVWLEVVGRRNPGDRHVEFRDVGYSSINEMPYGMIKRIAEGGDFKAVNANINAHDALPDYLSILYMAGAAGQAPIIIIDQRGSEDNYAAIRKVSNPFVQSVHSWRKFYGYYLGRVFHYAIKKGVEAGVLKKEYNVNKYQPLLSEEKPTRRKKKVATEKIPIKLVFPNVFTEDPLNQARADALLLDRAVLSRETVASERGLDFAEEVAKMKQFDDLSIIGSKSPQGDPEDKDKDNGDINRIATRP